MTLTDDLLTFFHAQLAAWPQAAARYEALRRVKTRYVKVGEYDVKLQYNPARAVSSLAKVDQNTIANRPCFLCQKNRPSEQFDSGILEDFEVLVNPFPIFEPHFTIVSRQHQPQKNVDFERMAEIALMLPGMVVFYNGARAGASAPDHLHLQACHSCALPLTAILENNMGNCLKICNDYHICRPDYLPWDSVHFVSQGMKPEIKTWLTTLLPDNSDTGNPDTGLCNILMWADHTGRLHTLFTPRKAHRPQCYYTEDETTRFLISPGAVDMAGTMIVARENDFERLTAADVRRIYDDVSFYYVDSPQFQKLMLL